jgi:hypothetical protein
VAGREGARAMMGGFLAWVQGAREGATRFSLAVWNRVVRNRVVREIPVHSVSSYECRIFAQKVWVGVNPIEHAPTCQFTTTILSYPIRLFCFGQS